VEGGLKEGATDAHTHSTERSYNVTEGKQQVTPWGVLCKRSSSRKGGRQAEKSSGMEETKPAVSKAANNGRAYPALDCPR
jgi:hypothetical protein